MSEKTILALTATSLYKRIFYELAVCPDRVTTSRKGDGVTELINTRLILEKPCNSWSYARGASKNYLKKEFDFYLNGSLLLGDAVKCSKVWAECSDDGVSINSNYGAILLHEPTFSKDLTAAVSDSHFMFAFNALNSNLGSKKAVMPIFGHRNCYVSKDNPCTMFLQFYTTDVRCARSAERPIEKNMRKFLNLKVVMRSNDVWYGLQYDMPFFCFILYAMTNALQNSGHNIAIGSYIHEATSLHVYEKHMPKLIEINNCSNDLANLSYDDKEGDLSDFYSKQFNEHAGLFVKDFTQSKDNKFMEKAWAASKQSVCMKKKVGAVLVNNKHEIIGTGYGGRELVTCINCDRELKENYFKQDGCWSVHSEFRAIKQALKDNHSLEEIAASTMYVTHGPCDQCMKYMVFYGIRNIVYEIPYKDCEAKWLQSIPGLTVRTVVPYVD